MQLNALLMQTRLSPFKFFPGHQFFRFCPRDVGHS
jgi:hypothetical protein